MQQNVSICNLDWYRQNLNKMPISTLNRHVELLNQALHPNNTDLSPIIRADIAESIALLREKVQSMVPNQPASLHRHDDAHGKQVSHAWPKALPSHTLSIHLHFSELVDDWRIHPYRTSTTYIGMNSTFTQDGRSIVEALDENDLRQFCDYFELRPFIVQAGQFTMNNNSVAQFMELRNRFNSGEAHMFIDTYNQAMNRLTIINEERKRAVHIDNEMVGQITADHFSARERLQLDHIKAARITLAESARNPR